jgi:L-amino acid N-acyltransferase YncA
VRYVPFNAFYHLDYVRMVTEVDIGRNTGGIVAIDSTGDLQGIVLFDNWAENSVTVHISIQSAMVLRGLHIEAFKYIFLTCNRKMMIGVVPSNNAKAIRLDKHFGFTEIARIPNAITDGVDQIIYQLLRKDCQYLIDLEEAA